MMKWIRLTFTPQAVDIFVLVITKYKRLNSPVFRCSNIPANEFIVLTLPGNREVGWHRCCNNICLISMRRLISLDVFLCLFQLFSFSLACLLLFPCSAILTPNSTLFNHKLYVKCTLYALVQYFSHVLRYYKCCCSFTGNAKIVDRLHCLQVASKV